MSIKAVITRGPSTDPGTFGTFRISLTDTFWECHSLELPWKDNRTKLSCIPKGVYQCALVQSPKFGTVYGVQSSGGGDVEGRSAILIHAGNYGGDIEKGLRSDIEGCILLGLGKGVLSGQPAITSSRDAVNKLMSLTGGRPFELTIT